VIAVTPQLVWCALFTAAEASDDRPEIVIGTELLEVSLDRRTGKLTIANARTGRAFLVSGTLGSAVTDARKAAVRHDRFGDGEALQVVRDGGFSDEVMLFPDLPFALIRTSVANAASEALVPRSVDLIGARLDIGAPARTLRTLGTGGLHAPAAAPGSYAWLAVADPEGRNGVVAGWVTFDRGSGVLFPGEDQGSATIRARLDYGRLRIEPGETATLETLAIGWFDDARLGLEAWADAVARVSGIHLPPQPTGYCTWYHAGASDERQLAEQGEFATTHLAPFGFSVLQIDDGWQAGAQLNGPRKVFATNAADGPYPSGMKPTADHLRTLGLMPGLWFMPFAGTASDPFFADKQDWFVHRDDGTPYDTEWGGTCLDMTDPAAREYLRSNVRRMAHEWGYGYLKMDGLWTGTGTPLRYVNEGYVDDGMGDAVFDDPAKTNIEAYRDGLKLIREAAGPQVFILGCCAPQNMRSYSGAFGLVDAMRIGPDNGWDWNGLLRGPTFGSRHYFLNGRVWYNDPDPVYARPEVPLDQARLICSWVAVTGQLNMSSEWLKGLPAERLAILTRTMPSHGLLPRPVDLFEEPIPCVWLLTDERGLVRRDVVGLFNWSGDERRFDLPLERMGLDPAPEYSAFDYWADRPLEPFRERLRVAVPARSCAVLAVRPTLGRPMLLSTSRHVTQGIVDVRHEQWDKAGRTLSGSSAVVAGDPYELRIAVPHRWMLTGFSTSAEDHRAGVRIVSADRGELTRVLVESPTSRAVRWSARFAPSRR